MTEQQAVQERQAREVSGGAQAARAARDAAQELVQRPPVDIYEDTEGLLVLADMPGVPKERLSLRVTDNNLEIEGEAQIDVAADVQPLHAEVRSTRYRRTFSLSRELDVERIDAKLKDGVLTLRIPKRAELRPRKIEVQAA